MPLLLASFFRDSRLLINFLLKQSDPEVILGFSFCASAFDFAICIKVFVNFFVESNGVSANLGTAKFSDSGVTNSSAFSKMLHSNAAPSTSAVDFFVINFFKVDSNSLLHVLSSAVGKCVLAKTP